MTKKFSGYKHYTIKLSKIKEINTISTQKISYNISDWSDVSGQ